MTKDDEEFYCLVLLSTFKVGKKELSLIEQKNMCTSYLNKYLLGDGYSVRFSDPAKPMSDADVLKHDLVITTHLGYFNKKSALLDKLEKKMKDQEIQFISVADDIDSEYAYNHFQNFLNAAKSKYKLK